jgi:hypothetical protein
MVMPQPALREGDILGCQKIIVLSAPSKSLLGFNTVFLAILILKITSKMSNHKLILGVCNR